MEAVLFVIVERGPRAERCCEICALGALPCINAHGVLVPGAVSCSRDGEAKDFDYVCDVHCEENGKPLFCVYDDGQDDMLINAYMQGRRHGEQIGRAELQSEIRRVLGLQPPTIANAE